MLQYLATVESKIDDHYLNNQDAFSAFGVVLAVLLAITFLPLHITVIYFVALVLFLVIVFFLPFYTSRRHIRITKDYIRTTELPKLKKKIASLQKQLEIINQRIAEELNRSSEKSSSSKNQKSNRKQFFGKTEALAVLGLPPQASFDEVKKAYRQKIFTFHPDKATKADEKQQKLFEQETIRLNQAYATLKKVMR